MWPSQSVASVLGHSVGPMMDYTDGVAFREGFNGIRRWKMSRTSFVPACSVTKDSLPALVHRSLRQARDVTSPARTWAGQRVSAAQDIRNL
jgi:hypothetical protein